MNELRTAAELVLRRLQAEEGANPHAIAKAFEPLMTALALAEKRTTKFETKG